MLALAAAAAAGCDSTHRNAVDVTNPSVATARPTTTAPPGTSASALVPTVGNCGGGAYKPATLLMVCAAGSVATDATGVSWQTWGASDALGMGTVHLVVAGRAVTATGRLRLDEVKSGPVGPQFRRLVVTWIGSSPDGHPTDSYLLGAGA